MPNNKLGISVPWLYRTMQNKTLKLDDITSLIMYSFIKQGFILSNVYVREFPLFIFIHFTVLPVNFLHYKNFSSLLSAFAKLFTLVTKKNVQLASNLAPTLFFTPELLAESLKIQLFNDPNNVKKIIKKLILNYVTAIKQVKNIR